MVGRSLSHRTRLILDWWVIFQFSQKNRMGLPKRGTPRHLRKLLLRGFEVSVLRPRGPLVKLPLHFLLAHLRMNRIPLIPVIRQYRTDGDRSIYVSTAAFHYQSDGSWRKLWVLIRRLTR